MKTPVIVEAVRTPIGRARKGSLVTKDAFELARVVVAAVVERTKIDPSEIDDIVIAESLQGGGVIARHAKRHARRARIERVGDWKQVAPIIESQQLGRAQADGMGDWRGDCLVVHRLDESWMIARHAQNYLLTEEIDRVRDAERGKLSSCGVWHAVPDANGGQGLSIQKMLG